MRAFIQRVQSAKVDVNDETVGAINQGLLVLLGVTHDDTEKEIKWLSQKLLKLRIFTDDAGKMNLSVMDIGGDILVVSQFTLYASCQKGCRPDFIQAAKPEQANMLYERFNESIKEQYRPVETGIFGAKMSVSLVNDGPVSILLETPQ